MNDKNDAQTNGSLPPVGDASDPARAGDQREQDPEMETGDTLPPGVVPPASVESGEGQHEADGDRDEESSDTVPPGPPISPPVQAGNEDDEDQDEEPDDTLPPGKPPAELVPTDDDDDGSDGDRAVDPADSDAAEEPSATSHAVAGGDVTSSEEDDPGATAVAALAGEEDTLIGLSAMEPPDEGKTLIESSSTATAMDADTVVRSAVSETGAQAGPAAPQRVSPPAGATLKPARAVEKKSSGDWKWLALGAVGLVVLLGIVAGLLVLIHAKFPGGLGGDGALPALSPVDVQAPTAGSAGPGFTTTPPPAGSPTGRLVMPTNTRSAGNTPSQTSTGPPGGTTPPADTSGPNSGVGCEDDLSFVDDVTVPDDTVLDPGEGFDKTWRVRNNGNCSWNSAYRLRFLLGDRMGASDAQEVVPTEPGHTADISISMTAPGEPGPYRGTWQMVNAEGDRFGQKLTVVVQVAGPGGEEEDRIKPLEPR